MIYLLSDQYFDNDDLKILGLSRMNVKRSEFRLSYMAEFHDNYRDVMNYATTTHLYKASENHWENNYHVPISYDQCHVTLLKEDVHLSFFLLMNPERVRAAIKFDTANVLTPTQQALLDECKRLRDELPTSGYSNNLHTHCGKQGNVIEANWEADCLQEIEDLLKTFRIVGEDLLQKDNALLRAKINLYNSLDWVIGPTLPAAPIRQFSTSFSTNIA